MSTLFNSSEYSGLGTTNAQFVTDLYQGYLQRAPDDSGYGYWLSQINGGRTRAQMLLDFGGSSEFQTNVVSLCVAFGGSGGLHYVLSDVQGSTRMAMNNNGSSSAVVARHDYLPFGEEIGSGLGSRSGSQGYGATDLNRWKYGMTERDATSGLDHTWFRKYESLSGRWTSPDPLHGSIGDPQSLNGYNYTGNDPVNFVDPTGLAQCWDVVNKVWFECGDPVDPKEIVHVYTHGDPWRDLPRSMDIELFQVVRASDEGVGGAGDPVTQPKPTTKPPTNPKPPQSRRNCILAAIGKYLTEESVIGFKRTAANAGVGASALFAMTWAEEIPEAGLALKAGDAVGAMLGFHSMAAAYLQSAAVAAAAGYWGWTFKESYENNKDFRRAVDACPQK